jgi:predicted AAA+ superfamily ATPase
MDWIPRDISEQLQNGVKNRPAVVLTGLRQAGKTTLLRHLFPNASYITLDHPLLAREAAENPTQFFARFRDQEQVIIDEIQYAPTLLRELKIHIDENRAQRGKWILTGSQRFALMQHISESLAGRIRIIELETLSAAELRQSGISLREQEIVLRGGFPELWSDRSIPAAHFYHDYMQTYLERDVRNVLNVGNLRDFQRFMQLIALRAGSLLNYAELAKDTAIAPNTAKSWISVLEASGIITIVPPFFENIGKRVIKTPKIYLSDSGLLAHLLHINEQTPLWGLAHSGHLWEHFVISELLKTTAAKAGETLFYYRDSNGVELDALLVRDGTIYAIEAKMSEQPDERKCHFHKVLPLFAAKGYATVAIIAAPIQEGKVMLPGITMINPARERLVSPAASILNGS